MLKKIRFYTHLFTHDRKAFHYQLWMVYNRYRLTFYIKIFKRISKARKEFLTIHRRPFSTDRVHTWSDPLTTSPHIAIVLQGRLVAENNFTVETVRLYRKHFTNTTIIVSTDVGSDETIIADLKKAGALVIMSMMPAVRGLGNINLQIASTVPGLLAAKEAGALYVYKTRTDQRMYGVNLNEFLVNLIEAFPVVRGYTQRYRIIASSFLTHKFVPYLITDMWQFGQIDDMIDFWDAPEDTRTTPPKAISSIKDMMAARIAEMYLVTEYMKRLGRPVHWTLADSWHVYADHFCIVDRETLDLFWNKYDLYREYQTRDYGGVSNGQLLTFAEWFNLYRNLKNKADIPERALDYTRHEYVPAPHAIK